MRIGPSLQASLEVTVPDCGYYGLFRFREAVWKVDGVYQRDDCFRGNRTNPFLFNDHLPNCTYRKIITRPISPGNKTASFSHMRHRDSLSLSLSHPLSPFNDNSMLAPREEKELESTSTVDREKKGGKRVERKSAGGEGGTSACSLLVEHEVPSTTGRHRYKGENRCNERPFGREANRNGREPRVKTGGDERRRGTDGSLPPSLHPFRGSRASSLNASAGAGATTVAAFLKFLLLKFQTRRLLSRTR